MRGTAAAMYRELAAPLADLLAVYVAAVLILADTIRLVT